MVAYLLASQLIVSSAPALPPAQSARILAQVDSPANFSHRFVCTDCDGPYADIIPSRAGDGPFGPFPQYYFQPLGYSFYSGYGGYGGYGYYGAGSWLSSGPYVSRAPVNSRPIPAASNREFANGLNAAGPPVGRRR